MRNVVVTLRLCFAIKLLQLLMTIELIMLQMECLFTHTSWQTSTAVVTSTQKRVALLLYNNDTSSHYSH